MSTENPRPIVLCGPSGSGKSTLLTRLMVEFPAKFGFSVSHTTRKPRPGEEHGKHYYFTTFEDMESAIKAGKFLEHATFSGNMYGTSKEAVAKVTNEGKVCILDIDTQGVKQIMASDLKPWFIFIEPPSLEELEVRLRTRNTESEESLSQRLNVANKEMVFGQTPGNFHIIVTNDNVDHAYNKLKQFLIQKVFIGAPINGVSSTEKQN